MRRKLPCPVGEKQPGSLGISYSQLLAVRRVWRVWRFFLNRRLKRRLVVVTGVIIVVIVAVLAIVGGSTASKTVTVAEAASGKFNGSKVQVSGKVVSNSYTFAGDVLTFFIYDEESGAQTSLKVVYDKGVSATFGNDVTAICTGRIGDDGVLLCSELVTKCPSKYESSVDALGVEQLLSYGQGIVGTPVKVSGVIRAGSLKPAGQGDRLVITDAVGGKELTVIFSGALSEGIKDGSTVVLTGTLNASGRFEASEVALKG